MLVIKYYRLEERKKSERKAQSERDQGRRGSLPKQDLQRSCETGLKFPFLNGAF